MARISATTEEGVYKVTRFLGLNENPDGDTKLKFGEASVMRNWRITRDFNLQKRPGTATLWTLGAEPVRGLWNGYVNGEEYFLAACSGHLWSLEGEAVDLGEMDTENRVTFFPFSNKVFILNGKEYYEYDGISFHQVVGYRPLISISNVPSGGGELLEEVNKLNGARRLWFSPDGTATTFQLPESDLASVDYVKDNGTDVLYDSTEYEVDLSAGTVTFGTAPEAITNNIEIGYSVAQSYRREVTAMTDFELFTGAQDTRVFLYGDGSNECFYSSIDHWGQPRADYFPDLNEIKVGSDNTPITGMIRHYSKMLCFKEDSAFSILFGDVTLADGNMEAGFYVTPINKTMGNTAKGMVALVENYPRTLFADDLYQWQNTSSYTANLSIDERQAKRISDRIFRTLSRYDFGKVVVYDDNANKEYYICNPDTKTALVNNYAADAWYEYTDFDATALCVVGETLYIGTGDGRIKDVSYVHRSDDGEAIDAYWESGSVDFNKPYMRKLINIVWIGIKPEAQGQVSVTVQTDRKSEYTEKVVSSDLASFEEMNFGRFSFAVNRKPQMRKLKIKAKKFVFYKLIFRSDSADSTATVLAADMKVRFTGEAK